MEYRCSKNVKTHLTACFSFSNLISLIRVINLYLCNNLNTFLIRDISCKN